MPQTIYSDGHRRLIALLRDYREQAGVRQVDLADHLGKRQSFVSDYERGQRRLDLIELDAVCAALGVDVVQLVTHWSAGRANSAD